MTDDKRLDGDDSTRKPKEQESNSVDEAVSGDAGVEREGAHDETQSRIEDVAAAPSSEGINEELTQAEDKAEQGAADSSAPHTSEDKNIGDTPGVSKTKKKRWLWPLVIIIFIAVVLALLAYAGYFFLGKNREINASQRAQIEALSQQVSSLQSSTQSEISSINSGISANSKALQNLKQSDGTLSSRLSDVESRTSAQGKRLLAMSDTSRDDWLLAEAEYLLKLANQRVRIERSAEGSEALLEEADGILRDLEDPSLHNLRRAIAKDLAALRLMNKIDVEGIYLALVALTDKVDSLPLVSDIVSKREQGLVKNTLDETENLSAWQRVKKSFFSFLSAFSSYVHIASHDEKPELLAPNTAVYVQQNLRLMLERAQLAVLREQQDIYRESITQAQKWANQYYPKSLPLMRFNETLDGLKSKTVVQDLPDISESLNLLNEHIKNLHLLKGALTLPRDKTREHS